VPPLLGAEHQCRYHSGNRMPGSDALGQQFILGLDVPFLALLDQELGSHHPRRLDEPVMSTCAIRASFGSRGQDRRLFRA